MINRDVVGCNFASDWLLWRSEFSWPITEQSKEVWNHFLQFQIAFETQLGLLYRPEDFLLFIIRHLQNTGHMKSFVLVSEEAISKGIRRVVALTGPEALKAENKCHSLEERVENVQNLVEDKMKDGGLNIKETSQEITRISEVIIIIIVY